MTTTRAQMHSNWFGKQRRAGRGNVKLTEEDVLDIKQRLLLKETAASIGKDYRIGRSTVYNIKSGATWSHVQVPGGEEE